MKSTIVGKEINIGERTYPYIGKHEHDIWVNPVYVLFSKQRTGTVLNTGSDLYDIGDYSADWKESTFTVLDSNTQIVLQND